MAQTLTDLVRGKLNITWSDPDTDARVLSLVANAQPIMRHKLGLSDDYDFMTPGQEQNMLLAWCLYEWNHAAAEFDENYGNDILQVRQKWEVKRYVDE